MADNLVKFKQGTALDYAGLGVKDPNTLYFVTDEQKVYKGDTLFGTSLDVRRGIPDLARDAEKNIFYVPPTDSIVDGKGGIYVLSDDGASVECIAWPMDPNGIVDYTQDEDRVTKKRVASAWDTSKYVCEKITQSEEKIGNAVQVEILPAIEAVETNAKAYTDTAKAAVEKQIQDLDVSKLEGRVGTLETTTASHTTALGTIQGSGVGSIQKAEQDAKAAAQGYANTAESNAKAEVTKLANGQVNTNKTDIAGLKTGKADKATTLAGYGITDAYTKSGTTAEINRIVGSAGHLKRQVVPAKPSLSDANADTIYMIKTSSTDAESSYTEWMVIEGAWEKIGDTKVDLSPYAKTATVNSQISTAKNEAISTAAGDATTKAGNAETNAKSYADGLAKNYATATQGKTADSALQPSDIIEGTTQGAIHVNGSAVKVHGLGSAAYTASSAYATSTQGGKADTALQKSDIASGSANGTIAVKGTDVAVKGLGTAAYTNSGAYASSAQGTKADNAATALAGLSGTVASNISSAEGRAKSYADGLAGNYDAKGAASTAESNAKSYTNTCLTWGAI